MEVPFWRFIIISEILASLLMDDLDKQREAGEDDDKGTGEGLNSSLSFPGNIH